MHICMDLGYKSAIYFWNFSGTNFCIRLELEARISKNCSLFNSILKWPIMLNICIKLLIANSKVSKSKLAFKMLNYQCFLRGVFCLSAIKNFNETEFLLIRKLLVLFFLIKGLLSLCGWRLYTSFCVLWNQNSILRIGVHFSKL